MGIDSYKKLDYDIPQSEMDKIANSMGIKRKPVGWIRRIFKCGRIEMTTWKPNWFDRFRVSVVEFICGSSFCNDPDCPKCSKDKNAN